MERTSDKGKVLWKKIGGGSLRLGNRIVKPGQTFYAFPHDISETFRDIIIPMEDLPEEVLEDKIEAVDTKYKLDHRGGGRYNVLDSEDKVVNEGYLKKDEATQMIKELEG